MTTVSIGLAMYNDARFLGQQLQILASQERLPEALVVSDDASIDGTVAKIEAICLNHFRFACTAMPSASDMSYGYRTKRHWVLGTRALLTDLCLELPAGYRLSAARARSTPRRSSA